MKIDILYNGYKIVPYFNYWEGLPDKTLAYFNIHHPNGMLVHHPTGMRTISITIEEAMRYIDSKNAEEQ